MLERFRAAQAEAVARLKALDAQGALPPPLDRPRPSLAASLKARGPGAVIAEYKRASPSRGAINLEFTPEAVASAYARAGAAALSVLTEEAYFQGSLSFIARMSEPGLPLLRKDFLIHPLQVKETAATPASALLLIVRMLAQPDLEAMLAAADGAALEAVLEIFDAEDLLRARKALAATGTRPAIIQVNNRNLQTLAVDEGIAKVLIREKRDDEVWIAASGIQTRDQVLERAALGFDAVLVGSALMETPDPGAALAALTGKRAGTGGPS